MEIQEWSYPGHDGTRAARSWRDPAQEPRFVALLCHGYGEHTGRYHHVARFLTEHGALVHAVDHQGHGNSDGERVLIEDYERVVDDFHELDRRVRAERPDLPVVLIGHSMGGMIAARYAQRYGDSLAALVLSGPVLGRWDVVPATLAQDPIPYEPIDVRTLSRDPAVGEAYQADPLVWHGPFERPLLLALQSCLDTINAAGSLGALPTQWLHGEDDRLVPIDGTTEGIERIRGSWFESRRYPAARHEIFNETNKDEVFADMIAFVNRVLDQNPTNRT